MEQAAVLDRVAVTTSIQPHVRGDQAAPAVFRSRKESARRALLMWSGLDGTCAPSEAAPGSQVTPRPEVVSSGLFAADFRCMGARRTRASERRHSGLSGMAGLQQGFSERSLSVTRMVEHDDRVISYVRFSGRHTGEFQGHRPTGHLMQADGYVVHRFNEDGLIAQEWSVFRWS